MKYLLILFPFLFSLTTNSAIAADYYYCDCQAGARSECVSGEDSNDGLSKASPRQTFSNANSKFNDLFAGDTIKLCRGGSFTTKNTHYWVNNKCTSTNVCTVTDYDLPGQQNPQLALPIITQQSNNKLFALADGGNADPEKGYTFSNLDLRCSACVVLNGGVGFYLFNDIDNVTINNISISGFNIAIQLAGTNATNAGSDGTLDFININNMKIVNNISMGILGGANNLVIKNSYFENNGSGTVFDHNIYLSRGTDIVVKGNDLYRSSLDSNNKCGGVSLVAHGTINNLSIEKNVIREDIGKSNSTCWGIAVDPGYGSINESFTNVTIRGNKIINVGNLGIGIASCDTCNIENNVIVQHQTHSYGFIAISAPDRSRESGDLALSNISIKNNSIYSNSTGTGIILGGEGNSHLIVNNAIHYNGSENFSCYNFSLESAAYTAIDNNICFHPNSSAEWERGSGNLSSWQATGFDLNSKNANPEFKEPALPFIDLSSKAAVIVKTGHTSGTTIDYNGKIRGAQPDIGAFQAGTFNPPEKTNNYLK